MSNLVISNLKYFVKLKQVDIHIKGKASIQVPEEERLQIVLKSHDRGMFDN